MKKISCIFLFFLTTIICNSNSDYRLIRAKAVPVSITYWPGYNHCIIKLSNNKDHFEKVKPQKKGKKVRGLNSALIYISCDHCSKINFSSDEVLSSFNCPITANCYFSNCKRGPPVL
jgi:hypothetical protein